MKMAIAALVAAAAVAGCTFRSTTVREVQAPRVVYTTPAPVVYAAPPSTVVYTAPAPTVVYRSATPTVVYHEHVYYPPRVAYTEVRRSPYGNSY
jgi:hypothetical protein